MPMEGLSMTLAKKVDMSFPNMKIIVDCIVVAAGVAISFLFLYRLEGVREGTVITAIVVGKLIALLKKPLSPIVQRLCFGAKSSADSKAG